MPFPQQNPVNWPVKTESIAQNGASLNWLLADGTSLSGRERNVYWGRALPARSLMYGSTHVPPHKHSCPSVNNSNMSEGAGEKPAKDTDKQTEQTHKPRRTKLVTYSKNTVSKGHVCIHCCSFCMRTCSGRLQPM